MSKAAGSEGAKEPLPSSGGGVGVLVAPQGVPADSVFSVFAGGGFRVFSGKIPRAVLSMNLHESHESIDTAINGIDFSAGI